MPVSSLAQSWLPSSSSSLTSTFSGLTSASCTATGSKYTYHNNTTPETSPDRASMMGSDGDEDEQFERDNWLAELSPVSDSSTEPSSPDADDGDADEVHRAPSPGHKFASVIQPATPPTQNTRIPSAAAASVPTLSSAHPYRQRRPVRGLSPLTPATTLLPAPPAVPAGRSLPKSQPLARALFARIAHGGAPHAGSAGPSGMGGSGMRKKNGPQKIIVPTKAFKTTFELDLTASELARRA